MAAFSLLLGRNSSAKVWGAANLQGATTPDVVRGPRACTDADKYLLCKHSERELLFSAYVSLMLILFAVLLLHLKKLC